jgi:hypothetical protein
MGQVLNSKHNGPVEFEQTWAMGQSHVGLLTGGGYAHVPPGGLWQGKKTVSMPSLLALPKKRSWNGGRIRTRSRSRR